eukprot:GILJ01013678.1.p1 GENE.GILJ01013678.1~~GILJ01013678.1.p1  ORF type:complete len:738 (-),score=126.20 GILJ01013678.1:274-2487(-)
MASSFLTRLARSKIGFNSLSRSVGIQASFKRHFAAVPEGPVAVERVRNIGISAHIDSGKTTLTERILYYTGRIREIHEVKGKDGIGAKMDSMDLEREKGITIQSAATYCSWGDNRINIIDTPGHVDFTIEVERALRVLDSAIMVTCGVAGVQSQTLTVDRQMKRYNIPRLVFVNKLDRTGANPWKALEGIRERLHLNVAPLQIPIGLESDLEGLVDLVANRAVYFQGDNGEVLKFAEIPKELQAQAQERRRQLIETLADVDSEMEELFLHEQEPTTEQLKAAIRRATVGLKFTPMFMGSAYKNKGVQLLLDGVCDYLPNPTQKKNVALDRNQNEAPVELVVDDAKPFVGLAFKLEDGKFGQLTYVRVYQGKFRKGDYLTNTSTGRKLKIARLVRMHSNEMVEIQEANAGDIFAIFGVDCSSGDTFTDGSVNLSMTSMFVPEPVMSLAVTPPKEGETNFSKALSRFQKEDPTFRVHVDKESNEIIMSGMGELHLQIYTERMRREYNVDVKVGAPRVNYRETISQRADFNYLHKKQSGGSGQFGRVIGFIEPLPEDSKETFVFENKLIGQEVPPEFVPAIEKGFREAVAKGNLAGHPVIGVRVVLQDGQAHSVDSNEMAFRLAALNAFRQVYKDAGAVLLEPIMSAEIEVPLEFQGVVVANLTRRRGLIQDTETREGYCIIKADVPLNSMFGYSTDLRSSTAGQAEFSMEYKTHQPVPPSEQNMISDRYHKERLASYKK